MDTLPLAHDWILLIDADEAMTRAWQRRYAGTRAGTSVASRTRTSPCATRKCVNTILNRSEGSARRKCSHEIGNTDPAPRHRETFATVRDADFLAQMLYLDTKVFMTGLNFTYNDTMSMASSAEIRVPFLDRELVEFAAAKVPIQLKLKGFLRPTTNIFLQAMEDILPRKVLQQPKAGFAAPVDYWLANDLKEMVDDLLSPSQIRKRAFFRPEAVRRFAEEHCRGADDWSMQIWQFLTRETWMQSFPDSRRNLKSSAASFSRQAATA